MASGWNLWVWLEYIGVVIIIVNFPSSTCFSSFFWQQHPYFFVHFKMFFHSCLCYFCEIYSKRCSKNILDRSKALNVCRPCTHTRVPRLPCARYL